MSRDDYKTLRKLAQDATPGPWFILGPPWHDGDGETLMDQDDPHGARVIASWDPFFHSPDEDEDGEKDRDQAVCNFAFMAAANPRRVLGLLDRIAELEAQLAKHGGATDGR